MRSTIRTILLTAALFLIAAVVNIFAQDEQPGTTVTYDLSTSFCGTTGGASAAGYPLFNCYSVAFAFPGMPAGSGGSTWVYTSTRYANPPGAYVPYGWGFFNGNSDLAGAQYTITSSSMNPLPATLTPYRGFPPAPYVCNNNCSTFTANITGTTPDDNGTYSAVLTANLYYYYACGSGRGGGGCGNHVIVLPSQPGDGTGIVVKYN
jgi:hypothetical protein